MLGNGRVAGAQVRGTGAQADVRGARAHALGARGGRRAAVGQGCALGVLSLFLSRFDSVFFLSQIFGHCL